MWSNSRGASEGLLPGRDFFGPTLLLLLSPTFALTLHHVVAHLDGSLVLLLVDFKRKGPLGFFLELWLNFRSTQVWYMLMAYIGFQLCISKLIPGGKSAGPMTPAGNIPVYKTNGFQCFIASIFTFLLGTRLGLWSGSIIFDHMPQILAACNVFGLVFCAFLYVKGLHWPSSSDSGSTGSALFDYYWGTELHPRILSWDLKQFLVCRMSMTFWSLCILSCLFKQYDQYAEVSNALLVNVALQLVYIAKFFWWESGYLSTVDISHDRAGFYLCWGVLVWLPSLHTCHSIYLVGHPGQMPEWIALLWFAVGMVCTLLNYDCDRQRQHFRLNQGRCKIWGADPMFLEARYRSTANGEVPSTSSSVGDWRTSLLLASGWWGLSRHLNYLFELGVAVCTTAPVGLEHFVPWVYPVYLAILLIDRAYRDDAKCHAKYGKYWERYCNLVPYRIIPGIW